jgi:HAD superfamily hydrolase (TIGR01450 family)
MKDYAALLLDLDGVVYRGDQLLPGARDLVEWLDAGGRRVLYLSNNSFATPDEVAAKLARLGMPAPEGRVLTAGAAAVNAIAERFSGGRVFALAVPSVAGMTAAAGLRLVWDAREDGPPPDALLVGLDRALTYDRLRRGLRAILAGAAFVAVNRDPRLPVEDGFEPGTGSIVAALEYASGQRAEVIGKPAPGIVLEGLRRLEIGAERALMVGDALEMDVAAGHAAGVDTALVLTGVSTPEQARAAPDDQRPTYVFDNLPGLLAALRHGRNPGA